MEFTREYKTGKNHPVIWIERSDQEKGQPIFLADQDGSYALVSLDGLKGWAKQVFLDHLSFPADAPLDMTGAFQCLMMKRVNSTDWVNVSVEIDPGGRQMLIRYSVRGSSVCDSHLLED